MKNAKQFLFGVLFIAALSGCKTSGTVPQRASHNYLVKVGDRSISPQEFKYLYNKNQQGAASEASVKSYLDQYIRFQLKVRDAYAEGLDTTRQFKQDFLTYKEEITKPFLTKNQVTESLVKEAYERLKTEVHAAHILILLPQNASPADTLKAYQKIKEIRNRAVNGENFGELARQYSQDPSAAYNKGDLGWFTALQMVYPFENQAYATPAGEISPVFRTSYGYHILKVYEKRDTQGRVKVAHIMLRYPPGSGPEQIEKARQRAYEVYAKLQEGGNWFALCSQYSEDLNTKTKGGDLPWFTAGTMPEAFEQAAFSLQKTGDISRPIRTPYGWHIIKLEDKRGVGSLESMRPALTYKINNDSRSAIKDQEAAKTLKKAFGFSQNNDALDPLLDAQDTLNTIAGIGKNLKSNEGKETLFKIGKERYTVDDFLQAGDTGAVASVNNIRDAYQHFVEQSLFDYEKAHLAVNNPNYAFLLNEYKEGLLLFEVMNEKIWGKSVQNEQALKSYYQDHQSDYQWKKRFQGAVIQTQDSLILNKITHITHEAPYLISQDTLSSDNEIRLQKWGRLMEANPAYQLHLWYAKTSQKEDGLNSALSAGITKGRILASQWGRNYAAFTLESKQLNDIENYFNRENPYKVQVQEGIFEADSKILPTKISWKIGRQWIKDRDTYSYLIINKIMEATTKDFDEARPEVTADYQDHLEQVWLDELRKKYPIDINEKALQKVIRTLVHPQA